MTPRYSAVHSFHTNASQPSHLPASTIDTLRAAIWLQRRWPKAFPPFMTHAARQFSRSHNAPIPKCFSQHKPTLLFTCIRHRHNPRMYSVTTQMTQSVSYSFILITQWIVFHYYKSHSYNDTYYIDTSSYTKNLSPFLYSTTLTYYIYYGRYISSATPHHTSNPNTVTRPQFTSITTNTT